MSHRPHQLDDEFPTHTKTIDRLKQENAHFARLAEEYLELSVRIHKSETGVEPLGQFEEERLRKERLRIKDEIWKMIREAEAEESAK
ncbi:MAG: DUF465 domain-containing protein [Alphaproteobacteria bacterium]|nr:MAG: DUF465 domain-containing protein [Alphaproteobacteria bacterium]